MRRQELEHIIRAASRVAADRDIVIVGSQAILGEHPHAPAAMLVSREADVFPRNHPERADLIEGALGEESYFDETYGYYAYAVGPETAKAPAGWEDRLIPIRSEATNGATGWCLETHDVVLSKCVAGRERDWQFADQALRHGLVELDELVNRLPSLPVPERTREGVRRGLGAAAERLGK